jgi:protein TonB
MAQAKQDNRDRVKSAIGVAAFHALLGYAFITGLGFDVVREASEQLKMFDVTEELPPPPVEPPPPAGPMTQKKKTPDPEGAAAPPNIKNTPTEIVAPPPKVKLPVPPPIPAAPVAGQGSAPAAGAAEVPGPGTGRGGAGTGTGSGLNGNGTGGGGGSGRPVGARWVRGSIEESDYPRRAYEAGAGGTVLLRFTVQTDGSVRGCRVTRSSGFPELDDTTCRLIERRFRYQPARDNFGRPVTAEIVGEHEWIPGRRY